MSLLVFDPVRLPSFDAIRNEAERTGEIIDLFDAVDLQTHTGFLPMRVSGQLTGFEYYFVPAENLPAKVTRFGSSCMVTLTASFDEGRAAMVFLKVAARLTAGAYAYPDDDIVVEPEGVESYCNEQIEAHGLEIAARSRS